ncbi:MAG: hypothetical protein ACRDQF_00950 [Thermocrispum sp.]
MQDSGGIGSGAAAAVDAEAEKVYGPGWIDRIGNNLGGLRLEYTPELLDKVIAEWEDLCTDIKTERDRVKELPPLARGLSDDLWSQQYLQTHVTGLEDLQTKLGMMHEVAVAQLERHRAAKQTLDSTDEGIAGGFLKQIGGLAQ